jgi:hypothetical protein
MLAGVLRDNERIGLFLIEKPTEEEFRGLKYIEGEWLYTSLSKYIRLHRDEEKKYKLLDMTKLRIKKSWFIKLVDKKYFDSEKIREKSQNQKEGNNSIDSGIFDSEKIKRIKKIIDLDELIEEEVERRIREREQVEEDTSVVEDMKRIHHKFIGSIKIGRELRNNSKRNFLYSNEYKLMRYRVFESYLMKKDTDQSKLEIREKLRAAVNSRTEIFNKYKEKKTQVIQNNQLN